MVEGEEMRERQWVVHTSRVKVGFFFFIYLFFSKQAQPSERSGPRPLHPSFSLLHKNISDVGEVNRPRVRRRRGEREKS